MSAFMVSENHIDAIVLTALFGPSEFCKPYKGEWYAPYFGNPSKKLDYDNAVELGQLLTDANVESLKARYPRENHDVEPYTIQNLELSRNRYSALAILKLIQCYEYQACEYDGWESSAAAKFCAALTRRLITCLPGYDPLPWSISDLSELRAA
jgi:hypothetical protein